MARMPMTLSMFAWSLVTVVAAQAQVARPAPPEAPEPAAFQPIGDVRPIVDAASPTDESARHAQPTSLLLPPPEAERNAARAAKLPPPGAASGTALQSRPTGGWTSVFIALAVVLGLFFVTMRIFRRALPKSGRMLPQEAVEMLGRLPFPGRQQGHLLRVGNRIVLVSFSAAGADVITEVTDPLEVDRLAGICRQNDPHSSTGAFRNIVEQFFHERPRKTAAGVRAEEADDA